MILIGRMKGLALPGSVGSSWCDFWKSTEDKCACWFPWPCPSLSLRLNFLPTSLSSPPPSLHPPHLSLQKRERKLTEERGRGTIREGSVCKHSICANKKISKKENCYVKKTMQSWCVQYLSSWEAVGINLRRWKFNRGFPISGVCRLVEGEEGETEGGTDREGSEKKRLGPKACFSFSFSFFSLRGWRETNSGIVIFLFLYSLISNLICCTGNCNAFCL